MSDLYAEITARIVAELEKGVAPWVKPWATSGDGVPVNAATNRAYSGVNVLLLWIEATSRGWPTPRYLTSKQCHVLGGRVRDGQWKAWTGVCFVKPLFKRGETLRDGTAALRDIAMLRQFRLYNVAQCENLPAHVVNGPTRLVPPVNPTERNARIQAWIAATGADVVERGEAAFYAPGPDRITMPPWPRFEHGSHYYATLFHELGHWTGHKSRLDRKLTSRFAGHSYAIEELVAELTAAYLCAEHRVDGQLRHASYLQHWIEVLRADSKAVFTAASAAQKAADYLHGRSRPAETTPREHEEMDA